MYNEGKMIRENNYESVVKKKIAAEAFHNGLRDHNNCSSTWNILLHKTEYIMVKLQWNVKNATKIIPAHWMRKLILSYPSKLPKYVIGIAIFSKRKKFLWHLPCRPLAQQDGTTPSRSLLDTCPKLWRALHPLTMARTSQYKEI